MTMESRTKREEQDLPGETEYVLRGDWERDITPQKGVFLPQLSQLFVHLEMTDDSTRLSCYIYLCVIWINGKPGWVTIGEPCEGRAVESMVLNERKN